MNTVAYSQAGIVDAILAELEKQQAPKPDPQQTRALIQAAHRVIEAMNGIIHG